MRETICISYRCEDELTHNTETVPLSVVTNVTYDYLYGEDE